MKQINHTCLSYPDIDECANHTCANGASCVDGVNNYSCSCVAGYTGDRCQTGKTISTNTPLLIFVTISCYFLLFAFGTVIAVTLCKRKGCIYGVSVIWLEEFSFKNRKKEAKDPDITMAVTVHITGLFLPPQF